VPLEAWLRVRCEVIASRGAIRMANFQRAAHAMKSLRFLLAAFAACTFAVFAADVPLPAGVTRVTSVEGITEYDLANGLRVLFAPDASKPTGWSIL